MKTENIESIRVKIAALQEEIIAHENARLPSGEVATIMGKELAACLGIFEGFKQRLADCMTNGQPENIDDLLKSSFEPDEISKLSLGAAIAANGGPDKLTAECKKLSRAADGLRLPVIEKQTKLASLRYELYALELIEEPLVFAANVPRRPDVSTAAVLGIPDAALESLEG